MNKIGSKIRVLVEREAPGLDQLEAVMTGGHVVCMSCDTTSGYTFRTLGDAQAVPLDICLNCLALSPDVDAISIR